MARSISRQINKLLEYALEGLSCFCGHTPIKITNYVFNTQKRQGGVDYNSPEIKIIDVATECGFAASDTKYDKYGVGIDPYEYDDEL